MSASQEVMRSDTWRKDLFCFADENNRLFTVTNCPPIIHPIATATDSEFLANRPFGSLLRPQMSRDKYPELSFLLRKLPVGDPLLSRIGVDPCNIRATRYEGGWALADDLRNAWIALEKGLIHISELLMTSSDQSSVGTSARYAIRYQEHWVPPQDHGYRNLHTSAEAAEIAVRRAHGAFQILAARCSLAIALWQFPGPRHGEVPAVSTLRYDSVTASVVPDWIVFLRQSGIPSSWIDALYDSVIADFSINLRVGTVFDPTECTWLSIAPVLRAANVPVFFLWRSPTARRLCLETHPYLGSFAPPSPTDVSLALSNLPRGQPRVVILCRDSLTRSLPDYSAFDDSTPPFGPYQLPRESRKEFFARRDSYRADQQRRESLLQMERRHAQEAHAKTGDPPYRRTRVYLWVKPELIFPDLNPRWADGEYRHAIPPVAYKSLWMIHPRSLRLYNSFFDEWDLWFPENWSTTVGETLPLGGSTVSTSHLPEAGIISTVPHGAPAEESQFLLHPASEQHEIGDMVHLDHYILHYWYGITLADTRTYPGIDYTKWAQDMWHLFGETRERFPTDEQSRRALAGWVSAVMERDWQSRALQTTWDLDSRHPNYLLGAAKPDPREYVTIDRVRCPQRTDDPDNAHMWVSMKFKGDPEDASWTLLTTPMGAMLLVRSMPESTNAGDALHMLLCSGVPARTGLWLPSPPPQAILSKPMLALRRLRAPWRKKGERPTIQDYDAYCLRVLELCQSPHVRAAWLKGGIVWRIMLEITGRHPQADLCATHLEELRNGPSGLVDHYQAVTLDGQQRGFYDDGLTKAELDIIAGVVRVYTGRGDQTEDVSWWPKHSAWTRAAGYTGIWTAADERWFQRRLSNILEGKEFPLNAGEWKVKLKRQKKAGTLASRVEQRTWEMTYRNFVQGGTPSSVHHDVPDADALG